MNIDPADCKLISQTVGPLPIINWTAEKLKLDRLLRDYVPGDVRSQWAPAVALGVLLRNILLARRPLYAVPAWASDYSASLLGIPAGGRQCSLNDDRIGRALDRLFDADRAGLMTAVVVSAIREFEIAMDEFHNDSTTVTFEGDYRAAKGNLKRGVPTKRITYGHNKDHRPDLKQLVYNLTTTADGATPIWCNIAHGNTNDDITHIATWEALRALTGRSDFLYVADSKLCTRENMHHISFREGRFVTILPRTRAEVSWFADWMKKQSPEWVELLRQPNSRRKDGPDEVYRGFESPLPTSDGYRILWIWSSQKAERDQLSRQRRLTRAGELLAALALRLQSPRSRIGSALAAQEEANRIIDESGTKDLLTVAVETRTDETFKQARPGRPGGDTQYIRVTHERFALHWSIVDKAVRSDSLMDGIFPLVSNSRSLSAKEMLMAYKHQPALERRHEQLKSVLDVRPVFLKSPSRIEALLFVYFLAQLILALIELPVRRFMVAEKIEELPLYPEERPCSRPTTDLIFGLFANLRCHNLVSPANAIARTFYDPLSEQQSMILRSLDMPASTFYSGLANVSSR